MVRETRHLWVGNLPETVREDRIREHFKRSTEDVSPSSFEQRGSSYYDRNSRLAAEPDQYIRRPNNYHSGSDVRGRARDRLYRNGPYSTIIDRTSTVGHHRVTSWYDSSPSGTTSLPGQTPSPTTRSVYGNVASAVVQPDTSSYDSQLLKKKKSRSGSESPCGASGGGCSGSGGSGSVNATSSHSSSHLVDRGNGGSAASSRSHSRSPSSCSSTNSTSSNSHASSPASGSDPPLSSSSTRTRNLQSAVSAPSQSGMTINNQLSSTTGSSSSSSTGNPVVHSEDNRPLAICVRNLPARSSDTSLKDGLFHEYKKHGKVTWVKVVGQNAERYALVCFKKPDDVEKALEVSHDKLFFGCKIEVAPYQGYDVEDNEFRPYEAELDEYHPKSTRTLFIGNLEKDITGSELRKHFECFGEIIEIDIKKQGLNAYAFCQYSDIVSVVKAMRKMDGEHLGNNRIKLGFGKSMPTNCVWIDGIADSVSESQLSGQFSRYGPVSQVVIDRERKLALVSFDQIQYAQSAVKEMRGATLRGKKLQVDFASRECQEAFYDKLEKQTSSTSATTSTSTSITASAASGPRFSRYESQSRSRASSFSRHNNLNSSSGGVSPSSNGNSGANINACLSAAASTSTSLALNSNSGVSVSGSASCSVSGGGGSGSSGGGGGGGTTPRSGGRSRGLRGHSEYDYGDTPSRRFRSYDEYSQGSAASHDDDTYNFSSSGTRDQRSDSPQSRLGPISGGGGSTDTLEVSNTNSGRRRCDKSPGDIRNLQKERFHLLEQLEECPSSGDELVSPKKRMKFDHSSHHHNHHHTISSLAVNNIPQQQLGSTTTSSLLQQQSTSSSSSSQQQQHQQQSSTTTHLIDCSSSSNNSNSGLQPANLLISDSNCDVLSNHSNDGSAIHHRKCVEVRRLSECSSLKYATQLSATSSNSRRPSTESGTMLTALRHSGSSNTPASITSSGNSSSTLITGVPPPHDHSNNNTINNSNMTPTNVYATPHSISCKRRRTGSGLSISALGGSSDAAGEHHSSRGRGHQLHSHHSHEASGGESADGSRPGTPLCDERPEVLPSEPRRIPRDKPHEPMMLPLPKFGIMFFQQNRISTSALSGSASLVGMSSAIPSSSLLSASGSSLSSSAHAGQLYSSILSSSASSSTNINHSSSSNNINNNSNMLNASSSSTLLNSSSHSSLSNTLSSPPLLVGTRLSTSSFHHHPTQQSQQHHSHHSHGSTSTMLHQTSSSSSHHHHHHHHHHYGQSQSHGQSLSSAHYHHGSNSSATVEQPPASPLRPRSLSSNSSDSDLAAPMSTSPSIEERIKTLDEMYEIWSGGGSASARSHSLGSADSAPHTPSSSFPTRHKFLDLDVNEVKPSEIVKSVLAKKSIFDDDLQRLKNISDKYEPCDFTNLTRGQMLSSSSPGIPNLAATKAPTVGTCSTVKNPAQPPPVFQSPGVNQLQRLNSPMNSPQAMSPYSSPSPSPVVTTPGAKMSIGTQPQILVPQPAKSLQYPFPSHPPIIMNPATLVQTNSATPHLAVNSIINTGSPSVPSPSCITPTVPPSATLTSSASATGSSLPSLVQPQQQQKFASEQSFLSTKPKTNTITKSLSLQEKPSSAGSMTQPTLPAGSSSTTSTSAIASSAGNSRVLLKSASVPGSTNVGTVKSATTSTQQQQQTLPTSNSSNNNCSKFDEESDPSATGNASNYRRSSADSSSSRCSYSRSSSSTSKKADKIHKHNNRSDNDKKTSKSEKSKSESIDKRKSNSEESCEGSEIADKEMERLEEERLAKEQEEKETERDRIERERVEKDRLKLEKDKQDRERREKERERERKEKEERERKQREIEANAERERKEREERERKEREERERREKEERERRDREERERKEREEREEKERKEREEKERKEREERERREREEKERKEREERERRDLEEQHERKEREERERKERELLERKELEDRERKLREEQQRLREVKEQEECLQVEREKQRQEEELLKTKEIEEKIKMETEEHEKPVRKDRKDDEMPHFRHLHNSNHKEDKHNKENSEKHLQNDETALAQKRRERNSSGSSPIRLSKRRLSSQESNDNDDLVKRMKVASENRKILDRRDSKDPNRSSSKYHKSHSRNSSISINAAEEKLLNSDERYRKDSGFDEKKNKDKEQKKYEKGDKTSSSHKYKKHGGSKDESKGEYQNHERDEDMRSSSEKTLFDPHDLRSTDDDDHLQDHQHQRHRSKKEHKDKKRHDYEEDGGHRRRSELRRHDNNRHASDRKSIGRAASDEASTKHASGEKLKSNSKPPSRKMTQSSNESDSDEPKKHSIFDILDDGPYVSMYDKVKARSCKNMQKQEEEKKIKAKFTQLKQSRAKREEKKRSTSYDGDSDSDFDDRHSKFKQCFKSGRSSGFINSSSDEGTINRNKDNIISDSDSDARRAQYNRARLNELCDGDSSESGLVIAQTAPRKKISSKRNSRIASDSSDNEMVDLQSKKDKLTNNKDYKFKSEIKAENEDGESSHFGSVKAEKLKSESEDGFGALKVEIKSEPKEVDETFFVATSRHDRDASESETNLCSGSALESKDSIFDQLFSPETRKKHKKSKKRQKSSPFQMENDISLSDKTAEDIKIEKHSPTSLEHVFDELKRESIAATAQTQSSSQLTEKKKHKDRKEKRRERLRDEFEKSSLNKEMRHRLKIKKSKKSSKSDPDRYSQDSTTPYIINSKRTGEKMEDIFGPISDDESQMSATDSLQKDAYPTTPAHTQQPAVSAAVTPYKQEPLTPKSHTVEENEENKQKISSHAERERHRKEKREKKRKERERTREQHALAVLQQKMEDENSVDLDEAGRALEAQLMEDSDNKLTEETTPSTATTHKSDMADVFRFSDGDENSIEITSQEKKESHSADTHKTKEKKKKKKRSKEERHQRREHHHHSSSNHNNNLATSSHVTSAKLSIEVTQADDVVEVAKESLCKPSPSLPCLLDDSPPHKNSSASDLNLSISPHTREANIISPVPKTPTVNLAKQIECKKKPDKFIPGFDVELDEKISESAVQSISAEFTSPIIDHITDEPKIPIESPPESKAIDKIDEKSRVVISQEETEDAVAALLGESFGTSGAPDYSFTEDPCEIEPPEEEIPSQSAVAPVIPEEEAEEMRKAVQSLSNEDIDIKPDTPQSEQDLQIDTDTEEIDEDTSSQVRFDNRPKTPDIDISQIKDSKPKVDEHKVEKIDLVPEPPTDSKNSTSVITKTSPEVVATDVAEKSDTKKVTPPAVVSSVPQIINITPTITRTQLVYTPTQQQPAQSPQHQPQMPSQLPVQSQQQSQSQHTQRITQEKISVVRAPSAQFAMQPPTISIPEQSHFIYPSMNVMVSPRSGQQSTQQSIQQPGQFAGVRASSPHSPSMHRAQPQTVNLRHSPQLSPVMPQHVVIQQRQMMSPPTSSGQNAIGQAGGTQANIVLNRLPITPVLAPISKPIQPTNTVMPQPNAGQVSNITKVLSPHEKDQKLNAPSSVVYQSVRIAVPSSSSAGTAPGQQTIKMATAKIVHAPHSQQQQTTPVKTVIEAHSSHGHPQHVQQVIPVQVQPQKGQTVLLQPKSPHIAQQRIQQQIHQPQKQVNQQQQHNLQQQMLPQQPQHHQQSQQQQQQQMLQQHQIIQQRHHQIQMQQQQQKQIQQQQQQQHNQQQHQQQQQMIQIQKLLQMHPFQSQPQNIAGKDGALKPTASSPTQIIQTISGKDIQQTSPIHARIQQNVVVVRPQPNASVGQSHQITAKQPQIVHHASQIVQVTSTHQQPQQHGTQQQQTLHHPLKSQISQMTYQQQASVSQQQIALQQQPKPQQSVASQHHPQTILSQHQPQVTQVHQQPQQPVSSQSTSTIKPVVIVQEQPKPIEKITVTVPQSTLDTKVQIQASVVNAVAMVQHQKPSQPQSDLVEVKEEPPSKPIENKPVAVAEPVEKVEVKPMLKEDQLKSTTDSSVIKQETVEKIDSAIKEQVVESKDEQKVELKKPEECKPAPNVTQVDNVSVIKSKNTESNPKSAEQKSLLTEENVTKLSPEDDTQEQDSKEDSDYWSAKELNIDSVIKKVDALCSSDEVDEAAPVESKDEEPIAAPVSPAAEVTEASKEMLPEKSEKPADEVSCDTAENKSEDAQSTNVESDKNEETHDEEEFDEGVVENSDSGKIGRGGKRGRVGRGAKRTTAQQSTPTVAATSPAPVNVSEGVQTRRGKAVQAPRGRRGRGSARSAGSTTPATSAERKMRSSNSDQDVYEFHEDSGEENASTAAASKVTDRPRLILTIKSPGQATTQVVHTKTAPTQQPPAPISTPVPSPNPPPTEAPTTPPKEPKESKEEFSTPAANTRKSRRLQEKDGNRSTVDDIIEDVVRNSSHSPKAGGQTPPRRSTRNSQNNTTNKVPNQLPLAEKQIPAIADVRKSPRANRRTKDRKASETSVDSSDEKVTKIEEKSVKITSQPQVPDEDVPLPIKTEEVSEPTPAPEPNSPKKVASSASSVADVKPETSPAEKQLVAPPPTLTSKPMSTAPGEPSEPLTLIDPVTGVLTVVRQSKEGQYVPVPGTTSVVTVAGTSTTAATAQAKTVAKPVVLLASASNATEEKIVPPVEEVKATVPVPIVVVTKAPPEPPLPTVVVTSSESVPISTPVAILHKSTSVVVSSSMQQSTPSPILVTTTSSPSVSQPAIANVVQQSTPVQPTTQIRTHPLKAHVLSSQNKPLVTQGVVKVGAGVLSQTAPVVISATPNAVKQPSAIVQSTIVARQMQTAQPSQGSIPQAQMQQQPPQQHHNLVVNIPPATSPHTIQSGAAHSPRIQTNIVVKQQQPQQTVNPPQIVHVVTKPSQQQPTPIVSQQHQPMLISKLQQQQQVQQQPPPLQSQQQQQHNQSQQGPSYTTLVQGGKIIQQVSSPVTIQTAGAKHPSTIQVSTQHLQHHAHVQKANQGVSVVTHPVVKAGPLQGQPVASAQHHLPQQQQPTGHIQPNAVQVSVKQQPQQQTIHLSSAAAQQAGIVAGSQHIIAHAHQSTHPHQPTGATLLQAKPAHQQQVAPPGGKGVIGLHQAPQIMTGAVASPPLKQSHMASQQPVVTGASSLRATVPPISPQGQARSHMLQPGLPVAAFEANLHDIGGYGATRSQSPPPAHQQASPITPGEGTFPTGSIRGVSRDHFIMYQQYYRAQQESLVARIPYIPRSPHLPGSTDQKELSEVDESMVASPPLELRRPGSGPRTISVPHSLQSPQDRATDSPQVAQVYVHGTRIPHPHYPDVGARYFESVRPVPAEPPPAHRSAHSVVAPSPSTYSNQSAVPPGSLSHIHPKALEREREREQRERERDKERASIPGHTSMPSHGSLVPAMPAPTGRNIQVATPPHASQVPPHADSLLMLLQRYPVMWQGLLALKTDQAAVQMHFVFGNPHVARGSLPCNSDGTTPPLRIAQRMRLEQTQLEGVAKKMQYENEHCMLLALPCGRDHMDVLQQSRNLQTGFITYLQQKMAAGIVNIPVPGSEQAAYVVHIFPSCDFANENLERAAPDLKHRVAEIAHLLIVIATV